MSVAGSISIRQLTVSYRDHVAVRDFSLDIPAQAITVLIGPSGCGKTTVLKCLNRLIDLQEGVKVAGDILLDGESVFRPGLDLTALRRKMGLLSQRPHVLPMSIYDNVAYGMRIHGERRRKVLDERVERFLRISSLWNEVKDRLHGPASRLSIGQQQRLCLARGLAVDPEIILADEPTSALDPVSAERIEHRLLELKDRYTVVVVTHLLRQAVRLADHAAFVYLGELVEAGPAGEFFNHPRDRRTIDYLQGRFIEPTTAAETTETLATPASG